MFFGHAVESEIPSEQGAGGGTGRYKMDTVSSPDNTFSNKANWKQDSLMFHLTVRNLCSPSLLDDPANSLGYDMAKKATRRWHYKYRERYPSTYGRVPSSTFL